MNQAKASEALSWKIAALYSLGAIASFHLAYSFSRCAFLIALYLFCLLRLANLGPARQAFYVGFAIGMATFAPQLGFFWNIFKGAAVALWAVLAFWTGMFLLLSQTALQKVGARKFVVLVPFLWMGLEYFRSELYYLKFSWMNVGYVFSSFPGVLEVSRAGVYGVGGLLMAVLAGLSLFPRKISCALTAAFILAFGVSLNTLQSKSKWVPPEYTIAVAGVQMEFPPETGVTFVLDRLIKKHPEAELLVLSEYAFNGPIPDKIKQWCRKNQKYLVAGGKDLLPDERFHNTAFVVDPSGGIVFQQAKNVPIQFFKDGLPATEQKLWNSPWGRIGICICYDLSYRRVVDELVRQGAQAIIVPTMDLAEWGKHQHELHGRVAPVRAAEYGIPIFRVCSSGISQLVDSRGIILGSAPFPGDEAMLAGKMEVRGNGHLPMDHWVAPCAAAIAALTGAWLALNAFVASLRRTRNTPQ